MCNVTGENAFFTNLTLHLLISLKRFPVWRFRGQTNGKWNCCMYARCGLSNCRINLLPSVRLLSNRRSAKAGPRSVITDHKMHCALQFHEFKARTWCVLDLIYTGLAWWVSKCRPTLIWSITADCFSHWILTIVCYIVWLSISVYCWGLTIK